MANLRETTTQTEFTLELLDWLHKLAREDDARAKAEEEKREQASTAETRAFHDARRIGFLWRADLARVIAGAVRLREARASGAWKRFRERAGEEPPKKQDRPLPAGTGAATREGSPC
jgi:hypothetical protein